jgi:hypothetical protein
VCLEKAGCSFVASCPLCREVKEYVCDETLPIINKSKHPKNVEYNEQNGRTHVQEDKEPPKRANHKMSIKFWNSLLLSREAYHASLWELDMNELPLCLIRASFRFF